MPARRRPLALLVVGLLVVGGACSDDDGDGFPAALADRSGGTTRAAPGGEVCDLLSPDALREATGLEFGPGQAGEGSCTYPAHGPAATVTVNVTDLPADAELALETTASSCDEESVTFLDDVPGAGGAFRCAVSGVGVAAGTSRTTYAVVLGSGLDEPDGPGRSLVPLLAAVLANADARS